MNLKVPYWVPHGWFFMNFELSTLIVVNLLVHDYFLTNTWIGS